MIKVVIRNKLKNINFKYDFFIFEVIENIIFVDINNMVNIKEKINITKKDNEPIERILRVIIIINKTIALLRYFFKL